MGCGASASLAVRVNEAARLDEAEILEQEARLGEKDVSKEVAVIKIGSIGRISTIPWME